MIHLSISQRRGTPGQGSTELQLQERPGPGRDHGKELSLPNRNCLLSATVSGDPGQRGSGRAAKLLSPVLCRNSTQERFFLRTTLSDQSLSLLLHKRTYNVFAHGVFDLSIAPVPDENVAQQTQAIPDRAPQYLSRRTSTTISGRPTRSPLQEGTCGQPSKPGTPSNPSGTVPG